MKFVRSKLRLSAAVLVLALLPSLVWSHDTGRVCRNRYCGMCNRLHMLHGHGKRISGWSYSAYVRLHNSLHGQKSKPPDKYLAPVPDAQGDFEPTPYIVVAAMLRLVKPTKDELLCDLGCGDGRIVIMAAENYGCRAVGVEINKATVELARRNVRAAGVEELVEIIHADARKHDLGTTDIVVLYAHPSLIRELAPAIFRVSRIVSYSHPIPNVLNRSSMVAKKYPIHLWLRRDSGLFGFR